MKATVIKPNKVVEETKQKIKVAAYARVSTNSDEQEESYENQVKYYEAMIHNKPEYEFVGVYADQAISGTTDNRPQFQEMIRQAEHHNIDLIITKSISRFSRNVADLHKYIQKLRQLDVNVRFEEEGIETNGSQGTLLFSILGAIAQMEVENTSAHVNWTLQNKMKEGELVGQANPLGYDLVDSEQIENGKTVIRKKLVINEKEAETVRYIFRRYLEGIGTHTIAKELMSMGIRTKRGNEIWHDSTITGILKNEKYIGTLLQGKTYTVTPIGGRTRRKNTGEQPMYIVEENHDAIISVDDFKKTQEIMNTRCVTYKDGRKKGTTRNSNLSVFTSKIQCYYCGKNFVRRIVHPGTSSAKAIWQCSTYSKRGKENCPHCKSIDEELIKKMFVGLVANLLQNKEYPKYLSDKLFESHIKEALKENSDVDKRIQEMEKNIEKNRKKLQKLITLAIDTDDAILKEEFEIKMNSIRKEIEVQQEMLQRSRQEYDHKERQIKSIQEIRELIYSENIEGFNARLFNLLVDYIVVGGIERGDDGVLVSNPKAVEFYLNIDNIDQHHIGYYLENQERFEKIFAEEREEIEKDPKRKEKFSRDIQNLFDKILGVSEEEKNAALERSRQ